MEPPHPYWADHNHSDEGPNLLFATDRRQATEPSPPRSADEHDHGKDQDHDQDHNQDHNHSDEHLNLMYATVRQQRSFYPDSSLSSFSPPDSGFFSPSLSRRRARVRARGQRGLRVANPRLPPPPPPTPQPTSVLFSEELRAQEEMVREMEMSSGWSASSEASTVDVGRGKRAVRPRSPFPSPQRGSTNASARYLRRARNCIGEAVIAVGEMVGQIGELAGVGRAAAENPAAVGGSGNAEVGVFGRLKRKLFRVDRPARLKKAKVRFPLD